MNSDESPKENGSQSYFHYRATLRISGEIPDLDKISSDLNLRPTRVHRAGERLLPRAAPFKHDMWSYRAPVAEDCELDIHIQTLWSHIKANAEYLRGLKERCSVDVICGYSSNSAAAGFEVGAASLEMFIALDVPFGVSVIIGSSTRSV